MDVEALGFGYIVFILIVVIRYTVIELILESENLKDGVKRHD